jgi:hypothetical protein
MTIYIVVGNNQVESSSRNARSRSSSLPRESFVFYCGAVHTQLQAAAALPSKFPPCEGELHASGHTSSASIRLQSAILGGPNASRLPHKI